MNCTFGDFPVSSMHNHVRSRQIQTKAASKFSSTDIVNIPVSLTRYVTRMKNIDRHP